MRKLIAHRLWPGALAVVAVATIAMISLLSPPKAEAGNWWDGLSCYVAADPNPSGVPIYVLASPCTSTPNKEVIQVSSAGYGANAGGMMVLQGGFIANSGTTYWGPCYQRTTPTAGTMERGFFLPINSYVVGVPECSTRAVNPPLTPGMVFPGGGIIVVQPQPQPSCGTWNNWCQPVVQPQCGSWNNWCQPVYTPPVVGTPPSGCVDSWVLTDRMGWTTNRQWLGDVYGGLRVTMPWYGGTLPSGWEAIGNGRTIHGFDASRFMEGSSTWSIYPPLSCRAALHLQG